MPDLEIELAFRLNKRDFAGLQRVFGDMGYLFYTSNPNSTYFDDELQLFAEGVTARLRPGGHAICDRGSIVDSYDDVVGIKYINFDLQRQARETFSYLKKSMRQRSVLGGNNLHVPAIRGEHEITVPHISDTLRGADIPSDARAILEQKASVNLEAMTLQPFLRTSVPERRMVALYCNSDERSGGVHTFDNVPLLEKHVCLELAFDACTFVSLVDGEWMLGTHYSVELELKPDKSARDGITNRDVLQAFADAQIFITSALSFLDRRKLGNMNDIQLEPMGSKAVTGLALVNNNLLLPGAWLKPYNKGCHVLNFG